MKPREPENPSKINDAYDMAYPRTWDAAPSAPEAGDGTLQLLDRVLEERWERRIAFLKNGCPCGPRSYHQGLIDAHSDCLVDLRAEMAKHSIEKLTHSAAITGGNDPKRSWRKNDQNKKDE